MTRRLYLHGGLRVESELALPELAADERAHAVPEPDVRIAVGPEPSADECEQPLEVGPRSCRFGVPDLARFEIRDGRRILVRPRTGASAEWLRLVTLATAWAALLQQRGELALHAGVVRAGDGAVAFCGPSTAGKSSTVAWLARRGHALVSDDLCRVTLPASGPPEVWPSTARLKLSVDALSAIGSSTEGLHPESAGGEKLIVPWERGESGPPLPLRAIYLLGWGEPQLTRLTGTPGLSRLVVAATFRPALLGTGPLLADHWERCAEVMRRVPVFALTRPREWEAMEAAMGQVQLEPA